MGYDAFISYSSKDKPTADAVVAMLEQQGLRCWIAPRDIMPGRDWAEAIIDAIEICKVMVLVFSSNANASPQIKKEVERAVNRGVPIIPFRIEMVMPSRSLEYFISTPHWLDAMSPPLERHIGHLAGTIKAMLEGKANYEAEKDDTQLKAEAQKRQQLEAQTKALAAANSKKKKLMLAGAGAAVVVGGIVLVSLLGGKTEKGGAGTQGATTAPAIAVKAGFAEQLAKADALLDKHDHDEAIAAFNLALTIDATSGKAAMGRGLANFYACNFEQAAADFTEALKLDPNLTDCYAYRALATTSIDQDVEDIVMPDAEMAIRYNAKPAWAHAAKAAAFAMRSDEDNALAEALEAAKADANSPLGPLAVAVAKAAMNPRNELTEADEAIRRAPWVSATYSTRALLLWAQEKYDAALSDCAQALKLAPRNSTALAVRSMIYSAKKDLSQAKKDCAEAIRIAPRNSLGYIARSVVQRDAGEFQGALADANEACRLRPKWPLSRFMRGTVHLLAGKNDDAITDLTAALAADPRYLQALWLRGKAYVAKGDLVAAQRDFDDAVKSRPQEILFVRSRGEFYFEQEKYELALDDFQTALKLDPADHLSLIDAGMVYMVRNDHDAALRMFEKAVIAKKIGIAYRKRGEAKLALVMPESAISDFTMAIQLDDKDYESLQLRAKAYSNDEKYDLAIADLTAALKIAPKDTDLLHERAGAFVRVEKFDKALDDLNMIVRLEPASDLSFYYRGRFYLDRKQYELAIVDLAESVRLAPKDPYCHYWLGQAYLEKGKMDKAIACLREAVKLSPKTSVFYEGLVSAHMTNNDMESVFKTLDEGIDANPASESLLSMRAMGMMNKGEYEKSLDDFETLLRISPGKAEYRLKRINIYFAIDKTAEAMADIDAALKIDPKNAEAYMYRGHGLDMQEKNNEALAAFNEAIKLEPKLYGAILQRGVLYFAMGKSDEALKDIATLLKLAPDESDIYLFRALVKEKSGDVAGGAADREKAAKINPERSADRIVAIKQVVAGGQGEKIGIKAGDIVVSYDGTKIRRTFELTTLVRLPGKDKRDLTIVRDGQTIHLSPMPGRLKIIAEDRPIEAETKPAATQK